MARKYSKKHQIISLLQKHSLALLLLIGVFFVASLGVALATNQTEPESPATTPSVLTVPAMTFGTAQTQQDTVGIIKNLGTVTLVAQSAGPVRSIKVREGANLSRGATIIQQETAYAAGSAPAVQLQLARKSQQLAETALTTTVEQVTLSRRQADLAKDNAAALRDIASKSIDEVKNLIRISEQLVEKVEADVTAEQAGSNNPDVLQALRAQLLGYTSSLNQARASLRNLEYQADSDSAQAVIVDVQRDLAYKSTELQLQTAQIQQEIAVLNSRLAGIAEAATRVSAPAAGTVQKILVREGQFVSPGTPVAVISTSPQLLVEVLLAGSVALSVDAQQPAQITLNEQTLSLPITHLSQTPVSGQLYQALVELPVDLSDQVFENQTVAVSLPIQTPTAIGQYQFIPLDAVFMTPSERYVLVYREGNARRADITVGDIVGDAIEVKSGLNDGDVVILDRRVIDGQPVNIELVEQPASIEIELG